MDKQQAKQIMESVERGQPLRFVEDADTGLVDERFGKSQQNTDPASSNKEKNHEPKGASSDE